MRKLKFATIALFFEQNEAEEKLHCFNKLICDEIDGEM